MACLLSGRAGNILNGHSSVFLREETEIYREWIHGITHHAAGVDLGREL
jgi:hypothetical protein